MWVYWDDMRRTDPISPGVVPATLKDLKMVLRKRWDMAGLNDSTLVGAMYVLLGQMKKSKHFAFRCDNQQSNNSTGKRQMGR